MSSSLLQHRQLPGLFARLSTMGDNSILYDEATKVTARDGEVVLDGPDGVDVKLTVEAAEQTGESLLEQSIVARGQRRLMRNPHRPATIAGTCAPWSITEEE